MTKQTPPDKKTASKTKVDTSKASDATKSTQTEEAKHIGKNLTFPVTIAWKDVQVAYKEALQAIAQEVEIQGFRKGKAPVNIVEERLGKAKVYEETMRRVLPKAYADEVKKKGYKPVVTPTFEPKTIEEGKDWVFEAITAEMPKVELGDYKGAIQGKKAASKIWVPGKGDAAEKPKQPSEEDKMKDVLTAILENTQVAIPEIMIREETNHSLSHLIEQLERMHVTLEDYLKSTGKTSEQLRQEYAMNALATLHIEFAISEIGNKEGIKIEEKEIDDIIKTIPDEKVRELNNTPQQRLHIASRLRRQKIMEFLLGL